MVWGRMKWLYRREILRRKLDLERVQLKIIVPEIIDKVNSQFILKCASKGWRTLRDKSLQIERESE